VFAAERRPLEGGTVSVGSNGLAAKVEITLKENPYSGHVYVWRGRRKALVKVLRQTGR
jgi:transposase